MKRILIDGRVLKHKYITGVERYAIEITKKLREVGDVVVPSSRRKIFQHLWEHFVLPRKANKYKILFCPANICPIFKPVGVKYVTTIHDVSFLNYPDSFSFSYRNYYKIITYKVINLSDIIITVSNFEKKELQKKYSLPESKIIPIYNGISSVFLNSDSREKVKKENYILYVGSLTKRKNVHGLLKAFSLIYKELDLKLVIVGITPNSMKTDRSFNNILNKIPAEFLELKGHINNEKKLKELYRKATIFVFPSFYESFGFPILEAMACGVPVVASRVAAIPEICGDSVIYINPFDIEDICDGIIKVVKDDKLREKLINFGRKRASEFTWEKSAKKHLEVFEKVLNDG